MFATSVIVFREVLEAALILGIVMAATRGVSQRSLWVSGGVLLGLIGAGVTAAFAQTINELAAGTGQDLFNAGILFGAVLMLGWHNIWMKRHGKLLAQKMNHLGQAISDGLRPLSILTLVVALAVLREGSELVLFIYGIAAAQQASTMMLASGALAGLAGGAVIGITIYKGLVHIPTKYLFTVTGWLILLLAAGMASQGASYLVQAGMLPSLGHAIWDTSALLSEQSIVGQLLHTLIGYVSRPNGIQIIFYVTTFAVIGGLMMLYDRPARKQKPLPTGKTAPTGH